MKKSGLIVIFLAVLVLLISFVSAGFFGDIWGKITGAQVNETTETNTSEVVSEEPEPIPEPITICCAITPVLEEPVSTTYEWRLETECDPTLVGVSYQVVSDEYCEETPPEPPTPEVLCEEGEIRNHICPDGTAVSWCGCENNAWVCIISPENACPEEEDLETCAARIEINFDKTSYAIGDRIEVEVGIFDSQGNPIPNYPFYARMYDDRWHTPNLERTDASGYFRMSGEATQKLPSGVTKTIFNVYTKETASCSSVQDTVEIGLITEEPVPCGIGSCVPEPEPTPGEEEESDEEEKIFSACNGCEVEDRCYPMGYRKEGQYCSEGYEFVAQSEDDSFCENSFECKTNLCIEGECMSSSLWKKFIRWLQTIFGKEPEIGPGPKMCSKLLIEKDIGDYEYNQSLYGVSRETQAPLFSDDCEQMGTIKCCVAQYLENGNSGMALMCPYNDRGDVENLVRCELNTTGGFEEYNGEKVLRTIHEPELMVWTHKNHVLAFGKMPEAGVPEQVAEAYLNKYKSDLETS